MAETFKNQVDALTGFGSTEDDALSDWLTAGARAVLNILPFNKLERIATNTSFTNSVDVEGKKIISVVRRDNNHSSKAFMPCRKLSSALMGRVSDSSYMEAASESDPAYIIQGDVLNTYPGSNQSNDSRVVSIDTSITVAHGDGASGISNFPDEAEHAVVLYASRNALQRLMNNMNAIGALTVSVSAPSAPTLATVSYSNATNADASATAVGAITVATVAKSDISGDVPDYTAPKVGGATEELTATITDGTIGTDADFQDFSDFFEVLAHMIEDEEDTELAQAQLGKINSYISSYQSAMQNQLNVFNKENVRYQANVQAEVQKHNSDLQKAITQAQLDAADAQQEAQQATQVDLANKAADQVLALQNSAQTMAAAIQNNDDLLQKFNAELGKYSAQVNDEVQEYSANLQKDTAKYQWYGQQYQMVEARYKEEIQTLQGAL